MELENLRYLSPYSEEEKNVFASDEYVAPSYEDTPSVTRSKLTPRFGNADDIGSLITGTPEEQKSYLIGVVSTSVIILLIFAVWSIVLIVLKCLGKKVGCASGIPPSLPKKDMDVQDYIDDETEDRAKKIKCNILWSRIIFILCGVGNIISSSIFVHYGVNSLQHSIANVDGSLHKVDDVLYQTNDVLDQFVAAEKQTIQVTTTFEDELLSTTSNRSGYCFGKEDAPFRNFIIDLADLLSNIKTGITSQASKLQGDILSMTGVTSKVRENLTTVDWVFKVALAIAIIQIMITIILVAGVLLAWIQKYPKPFRCIQSYVVLPFFACMVFLSALFSCVFVCVSVFGSDFCFGNPDGKVLGALEKMEFNSAAFNLIAFYIKGCIDDLRPALVKNVTDAIGDGVTALTYTHEIIENVAQFDSGLYTQLCGTDAFFVTQLLNKTDAVLHGLVSTASDTKELLYCSNFNPIYVDVVYNAICYNGVKGIRVIFSTQLCIAVFSMIMITLRVSWQQIEQHL